MRTLLALACLLAVLPASQQSPTNYVPPSRYIVSEETPSNDFRGILCDACLKSFIGIEYNIEKFRVRLSLSPAKNPHQNAGLLISRFRVGKRTKNQRPYCSKRPTTRSTRTVRPSSDQTVLRSSLFDLRYVYGGLLSPSCRSPSASPICGRNSTPTWIGWSRRLNRGRSVGNSTSATPSMRSSINEQGIFDLRFRVLLRSKSHRVLSHVRAVIVCLWLSAPGG